MTFIYHLMDAFSYLLGRSYMSWFYVLPTAFALVYLGGSLLMIGGDKRD